MTCGFKNDMRNLVNFYSYTQSPKILLQWAIFVQGSYIRFELKKYRGVIFHDTGKWCKIWINPDLVVSKMTWGIGWTFIRAPQSLKTVHWWALFVQSIYCFSWKLSEALCAMTLKGVVTFKHKLRYGLKNDIRNLVNFHASSWTSEKLHFDWIRLSKAFKYLDEKAQQHYDSWHWRVMQSLKKNCFLVPKMTWGIWWILMRAVASLEICTLMYYFWQ